MKVARSDRISVSQLTVLNTSMILGLSILTLPRATSEKIGTPDVWISVLIAGFISILLAVICTKVGQRFPGKTFFEFNQLIVGKAIGIAFSLVFCIYYIMMAAFEVRMQAEVIRQFLLDQTPIEVTMITFLAVAAYLIVGQLNPIARLMEFLLPITYISILVVMLLSAQDFDIDRLRPVLGEGIRPVFNGLLSTALSYSGFESIMVFTAFVSEPSKMIRSAIIGVALIIVLYTINAIIVIDVFGVSESSTLTWPTLELIKNVESAGFFLENFEVIFIAVWLVEIFTTYIISHYIASLGISQLFRIKINYVHVGLLVVIYIIAIYPSDLNGSIKLGENIGYLSLITAGAMPVLLLIIAVLRKRGHTP
ncbi:GerAB/ArcD/ProY family transporter [Paenibacillus alba]|uniref:GerAB/ArcD/ProY family transporter n=1 Tax=Paenibacillus alba TaxID=1197127 RepID=A0ABU6G0E5_9BACL|nr:GerAB/ArcD/ProY family transporter [Paenibacillus alba]MEC0227631.1 GerAB/ArcD/ProY family transporter [Paenibacillus alba]